MSDINIKKMIEAIADDGCGVIYNDDGSGCAGPGYADADTLRACLENGTFDDAIVVDFDEELAKHSFKGQCEFDAETNWIQIEFNFGDNNYRQIAWIWEV